MELELDTVRYPQIANDHGRRLRLEQKPGVYAWFREFNLRDCVGDSEKFKSKLTSLLGAGLSDTFEETVGVLYNITVVERGGSLAKGKRESLNKLLNSSEGRTLMSDVLLTLTELQSPLYIGKASNIRARIAQHVTGESGLEQRLQDAKIPINDCYIKVAYLNDELVQAASDILGEDGGVTSLTLLIEEVITRLGPAAFVRRPG